MNLGSILLGILVSTLMGALAHLIFSGGLGRLLLYMLLSWLGFWVGHWVGDLLNIHIWDVGALHLGTAVLVNLLFLGTGHWLSLIKPAGK